ncbi:AGE family epimerase/isomerase [Brevundimonas viscosa]|uniref:Mannose-1-phosphate guanylyltransferase/mannose-6-phosphate isomerase n=1 Tax=Brevundimonas viscosa TaxID=871741 RepID=A0A1I6NPM5_9CAUL|nr:AGE family epimerase/isomerase [Brevundimonas viscosa]SFS29926.1 mannose-1-phosphate guanylyltransferase/mannose-6-phosphate isomerase [Brevundimonas viscosa]
MVVYPVILCGGAGTRLWPASRPANPKQFLDLLSDLSLFQETAKRVVPLADGGGRLIIVAGESHRGAIVEQLARLSLNATVLLEPEGRDSAAAMAAAALWIRREAKNGIALFVASDHHIPDADAFRSSVKEGWNAANAGEIVTFGVRPTEPSSAYGYIQPQGPGLAKVERFVEKPSGETAEAYLREGFLWNSGNFMVRADVLLAELEAFAPAVTEAVSRSLPNTPADILQLSEAFRGSPKISIDYAVMERSDRVSVLPVDFSWSDLGAWDAVASAGSADKGLWVGADGDACLVRAAKGMVVATAGVRDLAIIAEPDAVLVCSLSRAQEVKGLVERIRVTSPAHADGRSPPPSFEDQVQSFDRWMRLNAFPVWATLGVDQDGGFRETLQSDGACATLFRRARVQARQAWVYSVAGRAGWAGPWRRLVVEGLDRFEGANRRPDGLYRTRVSAEGAVLDDTASLYDQAFALLAFAAAAEAGVERELMSGRAHALREALAGLALPGGGWREDAGHPHQANAHMHLFEACLAWEAVEPRREWTAMADAIAALARRHFIDADGGFLREFFAPDWSPAAGEAGRLVEPGHQFEWAWLLTRWGRARGDDWAAAAAERLYAAGLRGIDAVRGVAVDELDDQLNVRSGRARLWPQTERLKAALILGDRVPASHAAEALKGLQRYLEPTGLWRDKLEPDGRFIDEPAPASSLYHIAAAWLQLRESTGAGRPAHELA